MKPIPAVGLSSSIIQIVDFAVRILSKDHKIYQPTDGEAVENHTVLQDIAKNLFRLSLNIDQNDLKRLSSDPKRPKLSEAAEHLLKFSDETKILTATLIDAVLQAQARGSFSDPKWQTGRDALLTVWKKKEITGLKKKLKNVRKEVDIALMIALRAYLDQSAETGLPVFSADDNSQIHHWEKWQNEAMDSIHTNDWKPKNKKHVEEFSKKVDALITVENEAHFCHEVFAKLHFAVMDDRANSIPVAHEGTFEWMFESPPSYESGQQQASAFLDWLGDKSGQNLFWITGKPGSGKSVLMKHMFRNSRLFPSLEAWSGASPGINAAFFFWNSGIDLQVSSAGLLRSLLYESLQDMIYGPLEQDPGIIQWLFADRWNQFTSYGGGMHDFAFPDLRRGFELMISDVTKKFFFLIDGLDELGGYPEAVVDLLLSATKRDNVKICTSSRPMPGFQNAFEKRPSLMLDLMMSEDVRTYVSHVVHTQEQLVKICSYETDDSLKHNLISDIVEKSSGVFLWATLSTDFLVQGASESDDVVSLQASVWALPSDLDPLLTYIFEDLGTDKVDLQQASQLFRLVDAHGYPDLLALSFANDPHTNSSISAELRPLRPTELTKRLEDMLSILKVQCKNFLTVFEGSAGANEPDEEAVSSVADPRRLKINYSHRSIKDFVQSRPVLEKIRQATGGDAFNSDEYWANASLWALKTLRPQQKAQKQVFPVWEDLAWCMEYALRLEEKDNKVRVTYLDEVGRAGIGERHDTIAAMDLPRGYATETFLDIALWLNLTGYVRIKAKTAERKDIKHAMEYNRAVRKMLGTGGEDRWIGERRRLKAAHMNTSPELFLLLEYYAKLVRFATPKAHMEMPEYV
ncbi:hypothetical protein K505DRAFT_407227 [Melanomma pulvis-pyrius CBS 109.77]|uniref:Uncharacterized protein n=1 Tax=Melanomma pulvis-pyrius CBS 109.77 TaxID=1314802 RepID=A0A6A6XFQ5_9PLEO|nr:hypothetical protein K505DRAFT_407227 [Melanomma pulvis-pyrius CBS 109.77]